MIDPSNARSIAVAERLGMKLLRDDVLLGVAVVVYVVTRDESRGSIVSWPSSPT
jgi:RimJ/RimL family protein N-acetyltransferase